MLIRSKGKNTLVDFNGSAIFWEGGYIKCASGGRCVELKTTNEFNETSKLIDEIQSAFLRGEKIFTIE